MKMGMSMNREVSEERIKDAWGKYLGDSRIRSGLVSLPEG